ncbi:MAG: helix-turn-helix transcriptional regulator [Chloroflexi bacterium]|nr:helix-turn-helix transcriptional regulator [Chloroflexota bacterium]
MGERGRAILQLVADDLTDQEIADHLHLSTRTVSNQLHHIYPKLGVKGRAGAVIVALSYRQESARSCRTNGGSQSLQVGGCSTASCRYALTHRQER